MCRYLCINLSISIHPPFYLSIYLYGLRLGKEAGKLIIQGVNQNTTLTSFDLRLYFHVLFVLYILLLICFFNVYNKLEHSLKY